MNMNLMESERVCELKKLVQINVKNKHMVISAVA